ncbi:hypothetical protein BRC72_04155 [Halobacteriales archaeon QH_7_66_36]|nr:MAG: hypothetical protein BRC72_04155 [Halobacteriales archaeon QH_7_66_36]
MSFVRGNAYARKRPPRHMFNVDPWLAVMITAILLFVLVVYLFLRRTLLAFADGLREGSRRD